MLTVWACVCVYTEEPQSFSLAQERIQACGGSQRTVSGIETQAALISLRGTVKKMCWRGLPTTTKTQRRTEVSYFLIIWADRFTDKMDHVRPSKYLQPPPPEHPSPLLRIPLLYIKCLTFTRFGESTRSFCCPRSALRFFRT